jgi:hypothetical protein
VMVNMNWLRCAQADPHIDWADQLSVATRGHDLQGRVSATNWCIWKAIESDVFEGGALNLQVDIIRAAWMKQRPRKRIRKPQHNRFCGLS